jgi:hypothetical protein
MIRDADIINSILALKADAKVTVRGNNVDTIEWGDGNPTNITKEQILAKQVELQAEYDAKEYARKRQGEYPSIDELVVALYDTEDKAAVDEKRAAVKLKYPKS